MPAHFSTTSADPGPINSEFDVRPRWRLGLITDLDGHVHVGASLPSSEDQPEIYVDLFAAVGAASVAEVDLNHLSVIVQGERIADLRRIILQCIDDERLRQRLLELVSLSESKA
ncbi:MAG: hypothetical protein JO352_22335 [Chloroflexi bacterium]|nr:hypothetical protein [Chloroflexota bacterium]MBV9596382.1 hypothetical protein [Chloroflexota bacterium]